MTEFVPEPGQWAFSNGAIHRFEVSELGTAIIDRVVREMERVMWNRTQKEYLPPTSSRGADTFECDAFIMRTYCWCGGSTHPDGCPPNLEWHSRSVTVSWYKHFWRGASVSEDLSPDDWNEFLEEALASVSAMDKTFF